MVNLSVSSSKDLPEDIILFGLAELKKRNVNVKAEERADAELRMVLENCSGRDIIDDREGLMRRKEEVVQNRSVELALRDGSESHLYSEVPLENTEVMNAV